MTNFHRPSLPRLTRTIRIASTLDKRFYLDESVFRSLAARGAIFFRASLASGSAILADVLRRLGFPVARDLLPGVTSTSPLLRVAARTGAGVLRCLSNVLHAPARQPAGFTSPARAEGRSAARLSLARFDLGPSRPDDVHAGRFEPWPREFPVRAARRPARGCRWGPGGHSASCRLAAAAPARGFSRRPCVQGWAWLAVRRVRPRRDTSSRDYEIRCELGLFTSRNYLEGLHVPFRPSIAVEAVDMERLTAMSCTGMPISNSGPRRAKGGAGLRFAAVQPGPRSVASRAY